MRNLIAVVIALGILVGVLGIILACIALWLGSGWREPEYRSAFLSVPEIEEVAYFLWYEEHTSAGLNLTEGRYLFIAGFDEEVGTSTDRIQLLQIGDLTVSCREMFEGTEIRFNGFNIIAVMDSSPLQL